MSQTAYHSPSARRPRAIARAQPVMDRLFIGGGAAVFAVLMGVVAQATWLYWR
jgi:hypothetical protein